MTENGPQASAVKHISLPDRFERPGLGTFAAYLVAVLVIVWSAGGAGWSFADLIAGMPSIADFLSRSWPPDISRMETLGKALIETFQMAIIGTLTGVILSIPLAILAARKLLGSHILSTIARAFIALFRTVPDLVWALIFVISVGLGPFAGTLALMIDTMGFCGRFFAEAMEDVDQGPREALTAIGARKIDIVACAIIPAALPSFITTSLFALEKATRSSVVLGLVGAGGIGLELKVAMDMFEYPLAATIIIMVFILVVIVEQIGALVRRNILET